jgi:hypothetical protein
MLLKQEKFQKGGPQSVLTAKNGIDVGQPPQPSAIMHKGVTHFSGLPAVSGAAIAAIKVIKASTIR